MTAPHRGVVTDRHRLTVVRDDRPSDRRSVSAALHARPTLEVAVLAGTLVEERHPRLAGQLRADPRHPWRRVLDTAALLRASCLDPTRALALAARERALGDLHVRPEGYDPDLPALRHALRVHCVLAVAAAGDAGPTRVEAEAYVREQQRTSVLLGAEPDDLAGTLAEVGADIDRVRQDLLADGMAGEVTGELSNPSLTSPDPEAPPGSWAHTSRLAWALVPVWARTGPASMSEGELRRRLRELM